MRQFKAKSNDITNRDADSVEKYLTDISRISLISPEEETILAKRISQGDESAIEKLTKANLRFVFSVAKQYQHQGLPLSDLVNEGNLGLIKAAQRFDETRGFKFISYAVWWVRQSILLALAEQGRLVRLPLHKVGQMSKYNKVYDLLEQKLCRDPSIEEIAEELECNYEETFSLPILNQRPLSVDAPISEDGELSVLDLIKDPNAVATDKTVTHDESLFTQIMFFLESKLNSRQRDIVKHFYGIGTDKLSLEDIGAKFNLTPERARQVKEKGIKKLRSCSNISLLCEYLG